MTHREAAHGVRILVATRSTPKAREIRDALDDIEGARLMTLDEAGVPPAPDEDAIEAFDTFEENAVAKARHFADRTGSPAIADDSGLVVDALGGAPGVRSKRFAPPPGGSAEDQDTANNARLLEALRDVPADRRTARFVCAAALVLPGQPPIVVRGTCEGRIADRLRGGHGFGYDPLFIVPELDRTFGELGLEEKRRRSHRAHAFRALAPYVERVARSLTSKH